MKNRAMNVWQRLTQGAFNIISLPIVIFLVLVSVLGPNGLICWRCGGLRPRHVRPDNGEEHR